MTVSSEIDSHQQQVERLRSEVRALRDKLRRAHHLATVGTMTAMVAHEFNNILTPIINYAQMARKNPSLARKAIDCAADGGQRATQICKAILDMTQGGTAKSEKLNLAELVHDTLAAMVRDPQRDGIGIILDIPAELTIVSRRVELQQVLLNLILNARTAVLSTQRDRRIEISARRKGSAVTIQVSDTGLGVRPENFEKIFEPFFTTSDRLRDGKVQGHGLGLAICRQIIDEMAGEISVHNDPGQGATFTLHLTDEKNV